MTAEQKKFDVVVVGASIGGLIVATVLQKRGFKVALIENLEQAGGRCGATERNGYWLDWGHRDGHGYGDLGWLFHHGRQAAEEVGLEIDFPKDGHSQFRVHRLPEGSVATVDASASMGEAVGDERAELRKQVELMGMEPDDTVIDEIQRTLNLIGSFSEAEAWAHIETPMGPWLDRNVKDDRARAAILQMLENSSSSPAEHSSLGRFVFQLTTLPSLADTPSGIPRDPIVGGMQGAVEPWVRTFQKLGGELRLGMRPHEIVVSKRQVQGVIALDRSSVVLEIEAPVVISSLESWNLSTLVDPDVLPLGYQEMADAVRDHASAKITWWAGLHRLPRRRADGQVEDFLGWQRIVRANAVVKRYYGGFQYPSAVNQNSAPPGKHLLCLTLPAQGEFKWRSFAEAKEAINVSIDYLRDFYLDIDDCLDWAEYQFMPEQVMAWALKPVRRPPLKVATVEGLYVVSPTVEGKASWIDKDAQVALEAAAIVTREFGHLRNAIRTA